MDLTSRGKNVIGYLSQELYKLKGDSNISHDIYYVVFGLIRVCFQCLYLSIIFSDVTS